MLFRSTLVTPETGEEIWELAERLESEGIEIRPQAGARLASILMTLEGTVNPMRQFPSYSAIRDLTIEEQKKALRSEEFRLQVMADEPKLARDRDTNKMISSWDRMFVLPEDLSYEPGYEDSLEGRAARNGISVREALMDAMADGRPILYLFGDYDYSVQPQFDFISRDRSVFGLSDGGAHVGEIGRASCRERV